MRERAKCTTCRFFDSLDDEHGYCKVDPPKRDKEGNGLWPMIPYYEWCGRHRPFFKVVNTPMGAMMKPVEEGDEE